jgi:hypothetical protein
MPTRSAISIHPQIICQAPIGVHGNEGYLNQLLGGPHGENPKAQGGLKPWLMPTIWARILTAVVIVPSSAKRNACDASEVIGAEAVH